MFLTKRSFLDRASEDQVIKVSFPENQDFINSLPYEILVEIFSYLETKQLTKIAEVCRRWREISKEASLWQSVTVSYGFLTEPKLYARLLEICQFIKILQFQNISYKFGRCVEFWQGVPTLPALRDLAIFSSYLKDEELTKIIAEKCPSLEKLETRAYITEKDAIHITSLAHLRHLWLPNVDNNGLKIIARGCSKLEVLDLRNNREISGDTIIYVARLLNQTLKSFKCKYIGNKAIKAISECKELTSVEFGNGMGCRAQELALLSLLPNLRRISLSVNVQDAALEEFFLNPVGSKLEEVELKYTLRNLSDKSLSIITTFSWKELRVLVLKSYISDKGLEYIICNCKKLVSLTVKYEAKYKINILSLIPLELPNLKKLELYPSPAIEDHLIQDLVAKMPHLKLKIG